MAKEQLEIRTDVVDKFYKKLDKLIDTAYKKDNISYGEIEVAFLKMDEKILQQKITLMHQYLHSEEHATVDPVKEEINPEDPKGSMYG
jgi:hypothetical protein